MPIPETAGREDWTGSRFANAPKPPEVPEFPEVAGGLPFRGGAGEETFNRSNKPPLLGLPAGAGAGAGTVFELEEGAVWKSSKSSVLSAGLQILQRSKPTRHHLPVQPPHRKQYQRQRHYRQPSKQEQQPHRHLQNQTSLLLELWVEVVVLPFRWICL